MGKQEAQEPIAKEELLTELTTFRDQFTALLSKATESQLDAKTVDSLPKRPADDAGAFRLIATTYLEYYSGLIC